MPLCPGSRTVRLIPSCGNSIGGSPYSFANQHAAPLVSEENHSASRTLTTNQPSVTGASPEPASSSLASFTNRDSCSTDARSSPGPASQLDRVVLRGETVERRFDEVRQRAQVVAALQHRGTARPEGGRTARELAEPVGRHAHLRERVLLVRVEARGDEQQLRL